MRRGFRANLIQLAAAHESRGVHRIAHLQDAAGHHGARATRQFGEFGERLARRLRRALRRAARVRSALHAQPYQEDALVRFGASWGLHSGRRAANANSCEKRESRWSGKKLVTGRLANNVLIPALIIHPRTTDQAVERHEPSD